MEAEEESNDLSDDVDWDNSELIFSDDDDLIDPDFELAEMFDELMQPQSESDGESETAESANTNQNAAKRRRAQTIDTRPKKRKRVCVMPTTYTETEVEVEMISPPNGKNSSSPLRNMTQSHRNIDNNRY